MKVIQTIDKKRSQVTFDSLTPHISFDDELSQRIDKLEKLILFMAEKTQDKEIWQKFADEASSWNCKYTVETENIL